MKPTSRHGLSYGAVRVALAKIIHLHSDLPAVVRENRDGHCSTNKSTVPIGNYMNDNTVGIEEKTERESKRICSSKHFPQKKLTKDEVDANDHEETYEGVSQITKEVILEQIESEAESLGVEVCMAAKSMIMALVKLLAHLVQEGKHYLSDMEGLITTTHFLMSRKILSTSDIGEQFLKEPAFLKLPLVCIWRFSSIGVVSLEQIIKSLHDSKHTSLSVVEDLVHLVLYEKENPMNTSAVSEILAVLICIVYEPAKDKCVSLSKFANRVLTSLTERLLNHVLYNKVKKGLNLSSQESGDQHSHVKSSPKEKVSKSSDDSIERSTIKVMNIYELVLNNISISTQALEAYCSSQLVQVLTHRPELHLGRVLRNQENWRSTQANTTLSAWMWKLVVALGYEAALNTLDLVVTNEEVNWACILTLVATALNCHRQTVTVLKRMIQRNIQRGCEDQDMESLVIGFLFARHASQEGRHIFPTYSLWFSALFATESGSPVANKQAFVFLIQFLTDLVPHEPAYCLRAHLTNQIFTPKGCKEILSDYCYLAKARLQELREKLEDCSIEHQSLKTKNKVAEEVESAVKHFSETGKIANFILEASIFRKPHFRSAFLPALLIPRQLPDVPDARAKLIGALHSAGKISFNMYSSYIEACQKESSDLLTGVFIDVTQDITVEEPIIELSTMLQELVDEATSNQDESTATSPLVLPCLSRISGKIEEMMKLSDSMLKDVKYLTVDARKFNPKMVPYQVIQKIMETVGKLCLISSPDKSAKRRPDFLSQFVSLISSSVTLQCALFTYLIHNVKIGQQGELCKDQIENYGVILSELWKIEGLFLPIIEASAPDQQPQYFFRLFLDKLKLHSRQASIFACSIMDSWLQWSLMEEENVPPQLLHLYCCLAPRLPLIYNDQDEKEITVADVYSHLKGYNVPACSRLYFNKYNILSQKHKISLEKWIIFELQSTWEDTPIDVRQTYLKCRLLQDFVSSSDTLKDNQNPDSMSIDNLIIEMVFAFLKIGLKQPNSNEILMLIQSLAQDNLNPTSICLLEEWHRHHTEGTAGDISVLSFMSICGCLPSSLFLRADRLIQLSEALKILVNQILVASQDIQMNLHDTIFLFSSVLSAAAAPGIKNLQVQHCFMPLRTAIMFHWESLGSFSESHNNIIRRHSCLESLWNIMKIENKKTLTFLTEEESGIRLLALCLQQSVSEKEMNDLISVVDTTYYIKWLLAYLGLQQMRGSIPLFPDGKGLASDFKEQDKRVITACQKALNTFLAISQPTKIVKNIFPSMTETHLASKSVPTALVFILLYNNVMPCNSVGEVKILNQFELLLQCHIFHSYRYDSQKSSGENSLSLKAHSAGNSDSPNLEYLTELNQKIFLYLQQKMSSKMLTKLSKETVLKCESEMISAIKFKIQSKEN
ncbi:uncharacterized protein LOC121872690 isoform X1 [Homarus americanus]|uniref:uncharacterized protein LOC121872690 isoform X1 n=3 Tax=Homarus americanus TaxID=6706 RepID=UPI001C4975DC|nr:uncharacterized protein LOC121872690 isoform X1 [Homarus americanus]XP_042231613.1 uncharacterized protein LOC121872690 isoform X1 [Homarus americanus]